MRTQSLLLILAALAAVAGCADGLKPEHAARPNGDDPPTLLPLKERESVPLSQQERADRIRKEDLQTLIANLANHDDVSFASAPMAPTPGETLSGMLSDVPSIAVDSPEWVNAMIPQLFRVRRLLEESKVNRETVATKMQETLKKALANWPDARKEELARWEKGGLMIAEPSAYASVRLQAEAATYVLAEMQYHPALPLLAQSYRTQQAWIDAIPVENYRYVPQCPVPPPMILYAMHRLMSNYPTDKLSASASQAHCAYMKWAAAQLPKPKVLLPLRLPSAHESDPRNKTPDSAGASSQNEQNVPLIIYPTLFSDSSKMQEYPVAPYVSDRAKEGFRLIQAFVDAAAH